MRALGDSPAIPMPNGQPTPPAAAVAEAQAALGYFFQQEATASPPVVSGLTPPWSTTDVDGVYGARTQAALAVFQNWANTISPGVTNVNTSDGSLTTAAANEAQAPFDTLNYLRFFFTLNGQTLPQTFWGTTINPVGTPVTVAPAPNPGGPVPFPVPPGTPPAPPPSQTTTVKTGMSTGEVIALVAAGIVVVGGIAYAVEKNHKPGARAKRAVRRVARRAARRR